MHHFLASVTGKNGEKAVTCLGQCIQKALITLAHRWPFPYTTIKMANSVAVPSLITLY
jgi:hypothetical protein